MDWACVVVFQVLIQPCLSVLFTVEAEQTSYHSEFGGHVVMGCRFQPKLDNPEDSLKVTWYWISTTSNRLVYQMENRVELLKSQDPVYRGRVTLLTKELEEGWAKLKISTLRIKDSGTYQCLVKTENGADYKEINLSVTAPYKAVTKHLQKAADGGDMLLTCQSEGYPKSSVQWHDGRQRRMNARTDTAPTPQQLYKVTSEIRVRPSDKNNYTCNFTNNGHSATFVIPDELPPAPQTKRDIVWILLTIGMITASCILFAVIMFRQRKGISTCVRNPFAIGRNRSVSAAERLHRENDEKITITVEGCREENLGDLLIAHYSDAWVDVRDHGGEELLHRLQNNQGLPVKPHAVLPKPGQTLILEGLPGSGKTTLVRTLVTCWTAGPTHPLSDLGAIQVLLHVDCSKVKDDFFQEVRTQLSLAEKISEDKLKTVLTGSEDVLLLLDGYREGNLIFDESLMKFLRGRGGCRVLITSCPGQCPAIEEAVGPAGVLQLQTQTAMSPNSL